MSPEITLIEENLIGQPGVLSWFSEHVMRCKSIASQNKLLLLSSSLKSIAMKQLFKEILTINFSAPVNARLVII